MNQLFKKWILVMCVVVVSVGGMYAQSYPVHAQINVVQPLGVSMAEFQQATTPKVQA